MLLLLAVICTVLAPFYLIYKPPYMLIRYLAYRWPNVLWQVDVNDKTVALTIDDAPSQHTEEILSALKANNATATFFVIGGQVDGHQSKLRDAVRDGNELANHAMHDEASRSLRDAVLAEQVRSVESMIREAYTSVNATMPPKYFRPGSGFFSERMMKVLRKLEYQLVLGSVYPHDPFISFAWINARHIQSMVRPGAIIICHDRRSWTAPMLRKVLPVMRRRGYRVVTLTQLLQQTKSKSRTPELVDWYL